MPGSATDTEDPCIFIVSDSDGSNDDSESDMEAVKSEADDGKNAASSNHNNNSENKISEGSLNISGTKCNYCKRNYSTKHTLKRHILTVHKSIFEQKSFKNTCNENSVSEIAESRAYHHRRTKKIESEPKTKIFKTACENHQITCKICKHHIILPKGIQLAHGKCTNKPAPKREPKQSIYKMIITKKEMRFCPACKINFPNDQKAADHYWRAHKRRVFPCKYCDKYLSQAQKLKNHIHAFHE